MEEEKTVRRTRSGKVVKTPTKSPRAKPGPASRKTRKKVVLMEVEVSDEEETIQNDNGTTDKENSDQESDDKKVEESGESEEFSEVKKIIENDEKDKTEVNGKTDSELVVINNAEMIQTVEEEKLEVDDEPLSKIKTHSEIKPDKIESTGANKDDVIIDKEKSEQNLETDSINQVSKELGVTDQIDVTEKVDKKSDCVLKVEQKTNTDNQKTEDSSQFTELSDKEIDAKSDIDQEKSKSDIVQEKQSNEKEEIIKSVQVDVEDEKMDVDSIKDSSVETNETNVKKADPNIETMTEKAETKKKNEEDTVVATKDDTLSENNENSLKATSETSEQNKEEKQGDPDAENISEDELPGVPVVKVPEAEEVSDEELPGPKRAELPADTEVVSEDELPTVKNEGKKEGVKRKLDEADYDPGSPTSENETPSKKPSLETPVEKEEKPKPKKLPELDKYWKAVNDDPTDFTGWTYLLQYVDQENDMEAAREAYDAFLSHYPYCYGYWRKYADYEKRKGNKKKCEEVFERGLKAIPLSVDLWIHYLTYVKTARPDDEDYVRSQFERALTACGLEFRSDRLWDSYIKWETEGKRLQRVTSIYDRLLATPTQGYTTHFDNFQEHIASNPPNKVVEVDEFLALRKEVRHMLKHDAPSEGADTDAPPGDEDQSKVISSDEETKSIRERIVSIRRKIHKATVNAVTARWNYEEGIKRPYFHVKPLERCQLKNWQDYLDYETEQGDKVRIIVLFERCLIACALYEEFWLKFVHYLENLKDSEFQSKIRDVYERACTIHHLKKPNLHLQWAMFEENIGNANRAAEILVNLEKSVPNVLQIAYRRINLERRRGDFEKCSQLLEHYIANFKNKMISSNISIKYSRFCLKVLKNIGKAQEVLKLAITKDPNNPRLYLQLIDLTLQKEGVAENEITEVIDSFLEKETTDIDQKVLFAQRKLEYLEDFGADIQSVQGAHESYQKLAKQSKDNSKKKEIKAESASSAKKEKSTTQSSSQSSSYGNYGGYGPSSNQPPYPYSGSQQGQYNYSQYGQGDQYQYQNWQYPQGGYGGYNQWGSYGGGYGY